MEPIGRRLVFLSVFSGPRSHANPSAIHSTPICRFHQYQTGILEREFFHHWFVRIVFLQRNVKMAIGSQLFGDLIEKNASDLSFQTFIPWSGNKAQLPRTIPGTRFHFNNKVTQQMKKAIHGKQGYDDIHNHTFHSPYICFNIFYAKQIFLLYWARSEVSISR